MENETESWVNDECGDYMWTEALESAEVKTKAMEHVTISNPPCNIVSSNLFKLETTVFSISQFKTQVHLSHHLSNQKT